MSSQQIPVAYPVAHYIRDDKPNLYFTSPPQSDNRQQQQQSLAQSHTSQPYTPGMSQQQPYHYHQHQQHVHQQNQQPQHQAQEQIHTATHPPSFHAPHQLGPESYPQLRPESQSYSHPHQTLHDSQSLEPLSCVACRARKLRCDRLPTACTRCIKGNTECVYPPFRRRPALRRRSVKELEARLAQVEGLLQESQSNIRSYNHENRNAYALSYDERNGCQIDDPFSPLQVTPLRQDLVDQGGMFEPLPASEILDELNEYYFSRLYYFVPLINPSRYRVAYNSAPHQRPPMCLQYAIWANASHDHPKYSQYHRFFYERARQYAERDELKGEGEYFLTLGHAQAWVLIATEEARSLQFSRAAMSSARCTRLVQMMGLHRMDVEQEWAVPVLGPASSWIETEERRRTFWSAYCIDSHASLATGWPSLINNDDIGTKLPSSEEAFTSGQEEQTCTLEEALTGHSYSTFAGAVMISHLFSIVLRHVQRPPPGDNLSDINGPFWKRHQKLDKTISDVFMYLPPQLRLPDNIKDPSAIHTNLHLHASYICLHHQAVDKAIDFGLDSFKVVSEQTLFSSASNIVSLMQSTSHVTSASNYKSPLIALSMFCAASVYVYHLRDSAPTPLHAEDMEKLNYLLTTMQGLASKHMITRSFLQQICSEIERHGLRTYIHHPAVEKFAFEGTSASIPLVSRGRKLYPRDRNKHADRKTMAAQLSSGLTPLECDYVARGDVVELSENRNPKYDSNIPQRAQGSVAELSSPTSSKSRMSPLLIPSSRHGTTQQQQQMPQQYFNAVHDSYASSSSVPSLSTPSSSATPPDTWKYRRPDPLGAGRHCASVPATAAADPAFPVSLSHRSTVEMTPRQHTSTHAMQGKQQQPALNPMPRGWSATQQYIPVFPAIENNNGRMAPLLEQTGQVPVSVTGWDVMNQVVMQGSEPWPNNEPQS